MTVKMSGAEFKRFWADDSWCFEGQGYVAGDGYGIDGFQTDSFNHDELADSSVVEIFTGTVWPFDKDQDEKDLITVAEEWLRQQATRVVVLEVPTEQVLHLKANVVAIFGAKVLG